MEYRHLIGNPKYRKLWQSSYGEKIGRLAQGMPGQVEGTNTIFFIKKKDVPAHHWRDITYGRIVVSFRPTVGWDVLFLDEEDRVDAFDSFRHVLGKASKLVAV